MRNLVMMTIGATLTMLALMGVLSYSSLGVTAREKADRIDTFNGRWMPLLPPTLPMIRTDMDRTGVPHCVITGCRVV